MSERSSSISREDGSADRSATECEQIFEVADVAVVGSSVVAESRNEAVVSVSVTVDFQVQETRGDIGVVMREEDDWFVWNLRV